MGWRHGFSGTGPPTNVASGGPGGAADAYLQNISGPDPAEPRQAVLNTAQWTGDYNTANVTRIDAQLANFGATDLNMRISIQGPSGTFGSTNPVLLPAGSGWRPVTFNLTSDALTAVGFATSLNAVLSNVTELRILSASGGPSRIGDFIAGTLGIDDVRALRLPGDANFDGAVNGTDFALLAGNFGKTGQTWNTGDFNFDSAVNGTDFALLAGNFGKTIPSSAAASIAATEQDWAAVEAFGAGIGVNTVPEPTALGLFALAPLLVTRRALRRPCPVR
jgi:hypothetical protein